MLIHTKYLLSQYMLSFSIFATRYELCSWKPHVGEQSEPTWVYVVKQKCTTLPPIKFGVLVRIINKKVYLHYDNKKEFFSKS